ncbi:histone-lysine N-methyltransferase SETMAR [Trichonephila clavipes]|nr:histone-lysine N-methyltransferase SETMAR [Trichonephila clavipes]
MATVFWDSHAVILIDYLQKGKPLREPTTHHFERQNAEKRPHLQKKENPVSPRQRTVDTSVVSMTKIHELRLELLDHPSYHQICPKQLLIFPHFKIALEDRDFFE